MTKTDYLRLFAEIVDAPPGSLTGREKLEELPIWDSLMILEFIVFVDKHFSVRLSGREIVQCTTVSELIGLLGNLVTS
jgi:acyl carrier protein